MVEGALAQPFIGTLLLEEGAAAVLTSLLEATDKDHPGPTSRGVFCWSWSFTKCFVVELKYPI